jgi:hypothetical protein
MGGIKLWVVGLGSRQLVDWQLDIVLWRCQALLLLLAPHRVALQLLIVALVTDKHPSTLRNGSCVPLASRHEQQARALQAITACSLTASCDAFCLSRFLVSRTSCSRLVTPCFGFSLHQQRPHRMMQGDVNKRPHRAVPCNLQRCKFVATTTACGPQDLQIAHRSAAPANSARSAQKSIIAGMAVEQVANNLEIQTLE